MNHKGLSGGGEVVLELDAGVLRALKSHLVNAAATPRFFRHEPTRIRAQPTHRRPVRIRDYHSSTDADRELWRALVNAENAVNLFGPSKTSSVKRSTGEVAADEGAARFGESDTEQRVTCRFSRRGRQLLGLHTRLGAAQNFFSSSETVHALLIFEIAEMAGFQSEFHSLGCLLDLRLLKPIFL